MLINGCFVLSLRDAGKDVGACLTSDLHCWMCQDETC
jgi:hypothetical protein